MQKRIVLVIVLAVIVASISYLEFIKPHFTPAISVLQSAENDIASPGASSTLLTSPATSSIAKAATTTSPIAPTATLSAQAQILKSRAAIIKAKAKNYEAAPEIADPAGFINSQPFKLSSLLESKVVLVDFWTYSCINCVRMVPYLNAWYQKYKDYGLEIVGIHTPEFDFEHSESSVAAAVQEYGIKYPVVLDNDQATWAAYQNLYWPTEYLIDTDGFIVYTHIGEGHYADTEQAIQAALGERSGALGLNLTIPTGTMNPSGVIAINPIDVQSPETYFGADRNELLANGYSLVNGPQTLSATGAATSSALYLDGTWDFEDQYAANQSADAKIFYTYDAKNVYMVASADQPINAQVLIDGKPPGALAGTDVTASGNITVQGNRLYNLVNGSDYGIHTIEIIIPSPGLEVYTFTFG